MVKGLPWYLRALEVSRWNTAQNHLVLFDVELITGLLSGV